MISRLTEDKGGAAAVEFALLATLIITCLLGIADVGIEHYERIEVQNAARSVALYALSHGGTSAAIQTAVTFAGVDNGSITASQVPAPFCGCPNGSGITAASCGANCTDGSPAGSYITVNVQMPNATTLRVPGLQNPPTLAAQATIRIQ